MSGLKRRWADRSMHPLFALNLIAMTSLLYTRVYNLDFYIGLLLKTRQICTGWVTCDEKRL